MIVQALALIRDFTVDENCMAPKGSVVSCSLGKDLIKTYYNCHRFDQSAINLISGALNDFNLTKYTRRLDGKFFRIEKF